MDNLVAARLQMAFTLIFHIVFRIYEKDQYPYNTGIRKFFPCFRIAAKSFRNYNLISSLDETYQFYSNRNLGFQENSH